MNRNLCKAIELLALLETSCVILWKDKEEPYSSDGIGIKPLMILLRENKGAFEGAVIADKVIGKAAALMTVLGGADAVYGEIMSEEASIVLANNNIEFHSGQIVPYIKNRTDTGRCPLESVVMNEDEPERAFGMLEDKIKELMERCV